MDSERWLSQAWREFGQAEHAGAKENARIVAMFRDAGHASVVRDEVAWCAAYCGASLERAGIRSTRSLMARSYLAWGAALAEPRMGAVAVFSRGSDPALGHVGFWLGESDGEVVLLGGNQGNQVSVVRYSKERLIGLRWLLSVFYPAEARIDLRSETREFYRLFYGVDPTDDQLAQLLGGAAN